jgi:hypothetical protein
MEARRALRRWQLHRRQLVSERERGLASRDAIAALRLRRATRWLHEVARCNMHMHRYKRAALQRIHAPIPLNDTHWVYHSVHSWRCRLAVDADRRQRLAESVCNFSPERRALLRGFKTFAMREPRWEIASERAEIRGHGSLLVHLSDRCRSGAIGSPTVKTVSREGVFRFAFLVGGGGSGVVVGVTDVVRPDATEEERANSNVWGLSLTHGCVFTKHGCHQARRGKQSIAPPLTEFPHATRCGLMVEVEVDVRTRRIAFGVGGSQLKAADEAVLPADHSGLRPWAFLWSISDRVALLPRGRPLRPTMATTPPRVTIVERQSLQSPKRQLPSARPLPSPSRPLSPLRDQPSTRLSSRPSDRQRRLSSRSRPWSQGGSAPNTPALPIGSAGRHPRHTSAATVFEDNDEGALPLPAAPLTPAEHKKEEQVASQPHLFEFALGLFEERQRHSPREQPRSFSWDVMKRVTTLYRDVYSQMW